VTPKVFYEMTSVASHDTDNVVGSVCGIDEKRYSFLRRLLRGNYRLLFEVY